MFSRKEATASAATLGGDRERTSSTWSKWTSGEAPRSPVSSTPTSPLLKTRFGESSSSIRLQSPSEQSRAFSTTQMRLGISQTLDSQASSPGRTDELVLQDANYQNSMDILEKNHHQVLEDQWKLLRKQIQSLMGALSETRSELHDVKIKMQSNASDVEEVLERMSAAHQEHDKDNSITVERVNYLEAFIGDSLAKQETQSANTASAQEKRFSEMEAFIGDSLTNVESQMADTRGAHERRFSELQAFISDALLKQETQLVDTRAALETRLSEHRTTIDVRLVDLARNEQLATVDRRIDALESLLGTSAGKHDKAIAQLEQKLGASQSEIAELFQTVGKVAQSEHVCTLQKRVEYVETFLGESADKHAKDLADHKVSYSAHKKSMEERLEYIESLCGDSADKHAKAFDALESHKTGMQQRLEYLEAVIGDSAKLKERQISELDAKMGNLHSAITECAKVQTQGTLEERIGGLEANLSDTTAKLSDTTARLTGLVKSDTMILLENALTTLTEATNTKVGVLEANLTDTTTRLSDLRTGLAGYVKTDKMIALENGLKAFTELVEEHKGDFESYKCETTVRIGELADKPETEAIRAKLKDIHSRVSTNESLLEKFKIGLEDRFDVAERKALDFEDGYSRKMSQFESGQGRLRGTDEELHNAIRSIQAQHESGAGSLGERLVQIEQSINECTDRLAKEVEINQGRIHENTSRIEATKLVYETYKANVEPRLQDLEKATKEGAQTAELSKLIKEFGKTLSSMQEEQKRACNVLESTLSEQMQFQVTQLQEKWEMELNNMRALQDGNTVLVGQERNVRESSEAMLYQQMQEFEAEVQRLYIKIESLPAPPLFSYRPPEEVVTREVITTQPRPQTILLQAVQQTRSATPVRMATPSRRIVTAPQTVMTSGSLRAPAVASGTHSVPAAILPVGLTRERVRTASTVLTTGNVEATAQSPKPSISYRPAVAFTTGEALPRATVGMGGNMTYTGVDMNHDGIPDALQQGMELTKSYSASSISLGRTVSNPSLLKPQ